LRMLHGIRRSLPQIRRVQAKTRLFVGVGWMHLDQRGEAPKPPAG
jgi:hypothetical protein